MDYIIFILLFFCFLYIINSSHLDTFSNFKNKLQIFVISLPHSVERQQNIKTILSEYPFTFINAINGRKLNSNYRNHITRKQLRYLGNGEVGCFLSHRKCWKTIAKKPNNLWSIIFEDDMRPLIPNWYELLNLALQEVPRNVSILFLNNNKPNEFYKGLGPDCSSLFKYKISDSHYGKYTNKAGPRFVTVAYCITPFGAQQLLNFTKDLILPIDVQIHLPSITNQLNYMTLKTPLFDQDRSFKSTIR